jgi:hypothetical protein
MSNPKTHTRLTIKTVPNSNLPLSLLRERTENLSAFLTVETDPFEHWPYSATTSDDTAYFHETVQLILTEITEGITDWHVGDTDMDFLMYLIISRKVEENDL